MVADFGGSLRSPSVRDTDDQNESPSEIQRLPLERRQIGEVLSLIQELTGRGLASDAIGEPSTSRFSGLLPSSAFALAVAAAPGAHRRPSSFDW